ncbi:MAG: hypothetical protein LBB74_06505 [Chitinispirillales bacterium]|jgi:hypothetical protein|nr:hypothetical protein [Chitinispirillales bacterium]
MLTETRNRPEIPAIMDGVEEVEYPQAFVDELSRRFTEASIKIATGELVPQTVEELAAEFGIDISEIDFEDEDDND